MTKNVNSMFQIVLASALIPICLYAQMDQLHGDQNWSASGVHSGNQIRTTFWNDGQIGCRRSSPDDWQGEWPINSGRTYLAKISTLYGSEVRGTDGVLRHIISESNGTRTAEDSETAGDYDQDTGLWWTMAPLPGFHNPDPPPEKTDRVRVAMSHWEWAWPAYWPDKYEDPVDPGWPGKWNGYFGKGILNADQESYYVIDDYNNREFPFYPDQTDSSRRGLGLRVTVRGFQWSNTLVEDVIFWLFDVKNIGTHSHDKMNFGCLCGPNIGALNNAGDDTDDGGAYDLEHNLGYQYDADDTGTGGWSPVGYLGLTFFETPGNPFDGIDNDGDGKNGSGPVITPEIFEPKTINVGDPIILIDYKTFERTLTTMPAEGATIVYLDREITIMPGDLEEVPKNLIDDNLNGLIDENNGSLFGEGDEVVHRYLFQDLKYVNYFTGEGMDNYLIDEERDNGIDEDGDWDPEFDDVGMDGVPNTQDPGEKDGIPTSGAGTDLPGEPHLDKTDIDESDMIGLTAFNIYSPWTIYPLQEDEIIWEAIEPGFLNAMGQIGNTDIALGSGYFPLIPEQIERFSIGYIMGYGDEMFRNRDYAETAYRQNYNFSKSPYIPTVTAVQGDGQVTLYWNDIAEQSVDPILGYDFEGYRIYRSTDPGWNDMEVIKDGYGSAAGHWPIAQFDLNNGIQGFAGQPINGVHYWLGKDTGLEHSWTDTDVRNGQTYYYAVTSYDRGSDSLGVAPSECAKYISITADGTIDKAKNVVVVRPSAPAAGYHAADLEISLLAGSRTTGSIDFSIVDPNAIKDGHTYQLTFADTIFQVTGRPDTLYTKSFTLTDVTNASSPVTLIENGTQFRTGDNVTSLVDGFKLVLWNEPALEVDTTNSSVSREDMYNYSFQVYAYRQQGTNPHAADIRIEFGELGVDTSQSYFRGTRELPPTPVNFRVINSETGEKIPFAFRERDGEDGHMTAFTEGNRTDEIILLNTANDTVLASWQFMFERSVDDSIRSNPAAGDYFDLKLIKPFLSHDVFEFVTRAPQLDVELAKSQMDRIGVVPNPYVVANSFEPINPYTNGRGPRELHFIHLPPKCTIKIFTMRGKLVQTLEHDSPLSDGTEVWNMLSKDMLDIAYGVYIYHVDAGELGQKIGKFAVVK